MYNCYCVEFFGRRIAYFKTSDECWAFISQYGNQAWMNEYEVYGTYLPGAF